MKKRNENEVEVAIENFNAQIATLDVDSLILFAESPLTKRLEEIDRKRNAKKGEDYGNE